MIDWQFVLEKKSNYQDDNRSLFDVINTKCSKYLYNKLLKRALCGYCRVNCVFLWPWKKSLSVTSRDGDWGRLQTIANILAMFLFILTSGFSHLELLLLIPFISDVFIWEDESKYHAITLLPLGTIIN